MQIVSSIAELREVLLTERLSGRRLGFVPTMGALHEGHLSLVRASMKKIDCTIASIFVNPSQFGPNEDFEKYPRMPAEDSAMLEKQGVQYLFIPAGNEIYLKSPLIKISMPALTNRLCGLSRPGHFEGVALIVAKLFNIVQPHEAFFGQKDLQQTVIIRNLVAELNFPVQINVCPIVREADGLAMSSRNRYLNRVEREEALFLYQALRRFRSEAKDGMRTENLIREIREDAERRKVRLDYCEVVNPDDLSEMRVIDRKLNPVAAIAAWIGKTRLIDNMYLFDNFEAA